MLSWGIRASVALHLCQSECKRKGALTQGAAQGRAMDRTLSAGIFEHGAARDGAARPFATYDASADRWVNHFHSSFITLGPLLWPNSPLFMIYSSDYLLKPSPSPSSESLSFFTTFTLPFNSSILAREIHWNMLLLHPESQTPMKKGKEKSINCGF